MPPRPMNWIGILLPTDEIAEATKSLFNRLIISDNHAQTHRGRVLNGRRDAGDEDWEH
jgi:hypothetical protein